MSEVSPLLKKIARKQREDELKREGVMQKTPDEIAVENAQWDSQLAAQIARNSGSLHRTQSFGEARGR